MNAFYTGFQFTNFAFADNCWNKTAMSLDSLYAFNLVQIRRYSWVQPYVAITNYVGN